ncbi:MAG: peptide chain release factor N(5)-glutamine methyltransferase [Clostridiales bacterium]|nr:peptide chain release factor N(5)-glutamine methyltransferase [Clostridiales bacterium]MCI6434840.1 peptide chain release factor N(5)-glutamine methyltransferase [Clostridiales bacterium]
MTYRDLYLSARSALSQTENQQNAGLIARDLVCSFSGLPPEQMLAEIDQPADPLAAEKVRQGVHRLLNEEPLAYVLGEWEFYGLPLYVSPDVLIPRDDTCAVTELAINKSLFLDKDPRILDLCCGSGCIGLAVASRVKDARVTLADISREALAVAKKNIARNKLGGRVSTFQVDARKNAPGFLGKFDLIVSNPPYITAEDMKQLPKSVGDYEPHLALFGGEDGLDFYRCILKNFTSILKPGGFLCFEFGMDMGDSVCALLEENDYTIVQRKRDYNDRERAVLAQYSGKGN